MSYEKKIYLPGIVDCYQKPWFSLDSHHNVKYTGAYYANKRNHMNDIPFYRWE